MTQSLSLVLQLNSVKVKSIGATSFVVEFKDLKGDLARHPALLRELEGIYVKNKLRPQPFSPAEFSVGFNSSDYIQSTGKLMRDQYPGAIINENATSITVDCPGENVEGLRRLLEARTEGPRYGKRETAGAAREGRS